MKNTIILFFALLTTMAAFAQNKFSAALNFSYTRLNTGDTLVHTRQLELHFNAAIYATGKSWMSANVTYTSETFNGFPSYFGSDIQGLNIGLNWTGLTGSKNALTVFGQTGTYADGSLFTSNTVRGRAGFAWLFKHSDKFTLGFGLVYARQFYGNQLIPVIAVKYHFTDGRWQLSWLLPGSPKLSYRVSKSGAVSFEMKGAFSSYRLTGVTDSGNYIKATTLSGIFGYEYSFAKCWKIAAGAGITFRQKYELYNNTGGNGWYFIGSAFGKKPQPAEVFEHKSSLLNIGIAFDPHL